MTVQAALGKVLKRIWQHTMLKKSGLMLAIGASIIGLVTSSVAKAEQWTFLVQNNTRTKIIKLEAKEGNGSWSSFGLSGGIRPGETVKIAWAESANNQGCEQYLRATYADGSVTPSAIFDFCKDLSVPIVYSD